MMKKTWFLLAMAAIWAAGCGDGEEVPMGEPMMIGMEDPQAFDLGMDPEIFAPHVLPEYPDVKSCHTQGLEIVRGDLFISCVIFGSVEDRLTLSKAFLLKAPLEAVLAGGAVAWDVVEITESADDGATLHVLGHPSGIIYDEARDGIWSGNAAYGPTSYAHFSLYDPEDMSQKGSPIPLADHIGTIALLPDGRLLGMNWDSINLYFVDPAPTPAIDMIDNTLTTAYQDCDIWNADYTVCAGTMTDNTVKIGRMHMLSASGTSVTVESELTMTIDGNELLDLGNSGASQTYGDHTLVNTPLTKEGLAFSEDKQYIYFLPEDIPGGKLIRFTVMTDAE